jgi:hypothetical protein
MPQQSSTRGNFAFMKMSLSILAALRTLKLTNFTFIFAYSRGGLRIESGCGDKKKKWIQSKANECDEMR